MSISSDFAAEFLAQGQWLSSKRLLRDTPAVALGRKAIHVSNLWTKVCSETWVYLSYEDPFR